MTEATKACLHVKADFRYGYLVGPVCSDCHKRLRIIAYGCCDEGGRGKLKPECRDHWCGNNILCPATFDLTAPAEPSAAPEAEKACDCGAQKENDRILSRTGPREGVRLIPCALNCSFRLAEEEKRKSVDRAAQEKAAIVAEASDHAWCVKTGHCICKPSPPIQQGSEEAIDIEKAFDSATAWVELNAAKLGNIKLDGLTNLAEAFLAIRAENERLKAEIDRLSDACQSCGHIKTLDDDGVLQCSVCSLRAELAALREDVHVSRAHLVTAEENNAALRLENALNLRKREELSEAWCNDQVQLGKQLDALRLELQAARDENERLKANEGLWDKHQAIRLKLQEQVWENRDIALKLEAERDALHAENGRLKETIGVRYAPDSMCHKTGTAWSCSLMAVGGLRTAPCVRSAPNSAPPKKR